MNSKEDERKMNYLKPDPKPKVMSVQLRWISPFSKSSWIKTAANVSSYELGENGDKKVKLLETGILLIKMDIAHFTLVSLEIVTV